MGNRTSFGISTKTVKNFDLYRFLGEWYQIAEYNKFKSTTNSTITQFIFTVELDKNLYILKISCYNCENNKEEKINANIRIMNDRDLGKWTLIFNDNSLLPYIQNYWLYYDKYSIITEPTGDFILILSRKDTVHISDIMKFKDIINKTGYDYENLTLNYNHVYSHSTPLY